MRSLALFCCLAIPLAAQQGPVNLNFQDSGPGEAPTGWAWDPDQGYSVAVADDCRTPGSQCAVIRLEDERGPVHRVYLMQSFDAAAFRGKQIRYRASLRVEGLSRAQIFVRVDRPTGVGFQDYSLHLRSRDWTTREIAGEIDADAERITIGLTFSGRGSAYFADPELEAVENQQ